MIEAAIAGAWIAVAYLLGGVPFGEIVSRRAGVDIRARGTKNPGAANVYRQLGLKYGLAVFLLDVAKGVIAVSPLMLIGLTSWGHYGAAFAVVIGHILPAYGNRGGGTGMAAALGAATALAPLGAIAGIPAGLVLLAISRNAGFSGGAAFLGTAALTLALQRDVVTTLAVLGLAGVVLIKARLQYGGLSSRSNAPQS